MRVFASEEHRRHHSLEVDGGQLIPSWECPERADYVRDALRRDGHSFEPALTADLELVGRVHDADYLEFLSTAHARWVEAGEPGPTALGLCWPTRGMTAARPTSLRGQLGYYGFATDSGIADGTWEAAVEAAALAQSATAAVIGGDRVAFALCRPPGHHASRNQFGGYCYLNNAAVSAAQLLAAGHARVAVVDVDYHHGNGTQDIFYDRDDVLYCSIHGDPTFEFPYFTGYAEELGVDRGAGFNLNLPLPRGTGYGPWSAALERCLGLVESTDCTAMVVSLGVDTYEADPISHFTLTSSDFRAMGERLAGCGLPTVVVLEGGYAVEAIGTNVAAVLAGFEGSLG